MPVIHGQEKVKKTGLPVALHRWIIKEEWNCHSFSFDFPLITMGEELRTIES